MYSRKIVKPSYLALLLAFCLFLIICLLRLSILLVLLDFIIYLR